MKVKIFDESHEKELEEEINKFIKEKDIEIIEIRYAEVIASTVKNKSIAFLL